MGKFNRRYEQTLQDRIFLAVVLRDSVYQPQGEQRAGRPVQCAWSRAGKWVGVESQEVMWGLADCSWNTGLDCEPHREP